MILVSLLLKLWDYADLLEYYSNPKKHGYLAQRSAPSVTAEATA
jgi:hypothetical protein